METEGLTLLHLREMTPDEIESISRLRQSRTAPARLVERAQMIGLARQGLTAPTIDKAVPMEARTVRLWLRRFNAAGLDGLQDASRSGRPTTYTPAEVGEVLAAVLTNPRRVGLPFANAEKGLPIKRSRIDELLIAEGLRWRTQETWFGERATWTAPHVTDQC
jgi:transposase